MEPSEVLKPAMSVRRNAYRHVLFADGADVYPIEVHLFQQSVDAQ
jgi:hypothetical protein